MSSLTTLEPPVSPGATPEPPERHRVSGGMLDPKQLLTSLPDACRKLDPRTMVKNPVMFVVEVGSVLTTLSAIKDPSVFAWVIAVWLWLTKRIAEHI